MATIWALETFITVSSSAPKRLSLRSATVSIAPDWGMRHELMSQSYTTCIDQVWTVRAH